MGKLKKYFCLLIAVLLLASVIPSVALADDPAAPSTEIYVSANTEKDPNKPIGTRENPYSTLADAVNAINSSSENNFTIYVMSNLEVNSLARIADKHVTITSEGGPWTITRGDNMSTAYDTARLTYNPAMIEVTTPNEKGASVTLTNITLDDHRRYEGIYYLQAASNAKGETEFSSNYENSTEEYEVTYNNIAIVQDAIIAGYGTGKASANIILGEKAVLKNYGGMSAVRVTGGSTLTMKDGSQIIDDDTKANWSPTAGYHENDKRQKAKEDHGAAGAVWVQGTEATMNNGSEISNVVGRAIYADGGTVNIGGKIKNIKSDSDMWQGTSGLVTHVRNGATCTINQGAEISNDFESLADASGTLFDIMQAESSLEMKNGATIGPWNGTGNVFYMRGVGEKENRGTLTIDGEIKKVNTNGNHIVQTVQSIVNIGEHASIYDNKVSYGTLYIQGGNNVEIRGAICNNYSTDRGGAIAITNHGDSWVNMYDTAVISGNYSQETGGGILVSDGVFTMYGGIISDNHASLEGGGIFVREGGSFIMEGGTITNNYTATVGGGIAFQSGQDEGLVEIKNGTIEGNYMSSTLAHDENAGTCSVDNAGTSNDIGITSGGSRMATHMTLDDDPSIKDSRIYMQKYNFSIKRPAEGVKFGNAATDCETTVIQNLSSKTETQHLTKVVGSLWYQTDKGNLPLTVYDLAVNGNTHYNPNKKLYAAVVDTNEDGAVDQGAKVALYTVDVKANGSFDLNLPGGADYGAAVVFLQAADQNPEPNIITLKPVNLTAYMGGDQGYDAVVITGDNDESGSKSLPHPLFQLIGTDGKPMENVSGAFTGGGKTWTLVKDGTGYYHFQEGVSQPPVRVTYTNDATGETTLNDDFELKDVHDTFNTYTVALYTGEVNISQVTATLNNTNYAVALGTGTLTVRAVQNADPTTPILTATPDSQVAANSAAAVVLAGTTYTLNGLDGVTIPSDAAPSLLFDNIIASDGKGDERKAALKAAVDEELGGSNSNRQYEYKYLDLVDAKNGNAWIKASNDVTIYWGYPQGTDKHTEFKLVHFQNLHRDTSGGAASGINPEDITTATTEEIDVTTTDQGITFNVEPGDFSPYVLVWEKTSTSHNPGIIPTPDPDPTPEPEEPDQPELERDDHYAYIFGYEDNTIRPENDITRAEVATIFYRLLTDESREAYRTTDHDFTDVSADAWHVEPVATLAGAGLLAGYEDGSFRPDAPITRAEYAAIATRFDELAAAESNFTDISGHWAENAINAAYGAGWVGGYEDGTFRPDQNISRAEAMALINRVLERAVDSEGMLDEMTHWADNHPAAWYYADVQEATHSHTYEREEGEQYETWTDLVPHKVF